jgi:hypothetical protein
MVTHQGSHRQLPKVESANQESQRQLHKIESKEEFESKLNFQYVQKDLPKKHSTSQQYPEKFMQTFNPKTDESKCSTSYHLQKDTIVTDNHQNQSPRKEQISDIYLRDTSNVLQNLDNERQAIMNDASLGINQKIVTLQSL